MTATMRARAFVSWCVWVCLAIGLSIPGEPVSASTIFAVDVPRVTASAVYAIDVTAGVELYADNADDRRPPASTTKLAAALVVVNTLKDLTQTVTIEAADVAPVADDESQMGLEPGDILTLQQLLDGMLIQSGSDATYAAARIAGNQLIADGASGSDPVAVFVESMNDLARRLKLKNTHFANPVGIDQDNHYSSARDLATLAAAALKKSVIAGSVRQISVQTVIEGPNRREVTLRNTNTLLDGESVHGVKTGSTGDAGACLILAKWERGTNRVITVVLGSDLVYDDGIITHDKRWDDTVALLEAIERDVRWVAPADPNEIPGLHEEMSAWQVALKDDSAILVPTDRADTLRYLLQLGPAGEPNSQVGLVLFFIGSEKIAEKPVFQTPLS